MKTPILSTRGELREQLAEAQKCSNRLAEMYAKVVVEREILKARLQDSEDYIHALREQLADALERAKGWGEECEGSRLHCTLDETDAPDVGPADVTLYDHVVARLKRLEEFVGLDRNETGDVGEGTE